MKHLKKLGSVLLALVMVMALAAPAFADETTGTITVENATIGEDYSVYKIFDATYVDGSDGAAYTIESDSPWYNAVSIATSLFTLTGVAGSETTYNVSFADTIKASDITTWLAGVTLPDATAEQTNVQNTTVTFSGLGEGYFLVKSSLNDGATLTLTNAKPDATVKDKNQVPSNPTKTVSGDNLKPSGEGDSVVNSIEIGKPVTFTLTYDATNYDGEKKIIDYVIKDTMGTGMVLANPANLVVKVGDDTLTDANYSVSPDELTGNTFTVKIPWIEDYQDSEDATVNKGLYESATLLYDSPTTITVTYDAVLTADAPIEGAGITNTADFTYHTVDGEGHKDPHEEHKTLKVETFALAIKKVDTAGKPLEGATFTLTDAAGNNVNVTLGADGVYTVDPNSTSNEVVSPRDGVIVIKGVSHQDYKLTETKAPEGYNLLANPVPVTPTKTGEEKTDTTIYFDADGNPTEEVTETTTTILVENIPATAYAVVNRTGAELPSTGGIGTTIFYIVGGVLVLGAVVLLITKRRTSVDDE